MKIYDCFSYWDEDLLLDLRLNVLNDFVDYFVIVEGNKTWQNNFKKLDFFSLFYSFAVNALVCSWTGFKAIKRNLNPASFTVTVITHINQVKRLINLIDKFSLTIPCSELERELLFDCRSVINISNRRRVFLDMVNG